MYLLYNVLVNPGLNLRWVVYDIKHKTMRCEHPVSMFWLHADTLNIYWDFEEGDEVLADPKWLQQMGKSLAPLRPRVAC